MQSHWLNPFFVCSRSCSSKKRCRSKTHHSSHRVVLTTEKKKHFVARYIPKTSPTIYGNYEEVYSDLEVDVVYISTLTRSTRRIVWMPSPLARMCFARRL